MDYEDAFWRVGSEAFMFSDMNVLWGALARRCIYGLLRSHDRTGFRIP